MGRGAHERGDAGISGWAPRAFENANDGGSDRGGERLHSAARGANIRGVRPHPPPTVMVEVICLSDSDNEGPAPPLRSPRPRSRLSDLAVVEAT